MVFRLKKEVRDIKRFKDILTVLFEEGFDFVLLAKNLKIGSIINMSNVDYVYDKDPRKHKNTKKIRNICWKHFRKLNGNKWKAGLNAPFDPIASKESEKSKLKVTIIGKDLKNFENLLNGKEFRGTVVSYNKEC